MRHRILSLLVGLAFASFGFGCGGGGDDEKSDKDKSTGQFHLKGTLGGSALTAAGVRQQALTVGGKNITHVMAVNPSSANPERVVAAVDSNGKFDLQVDGKKPWAIVFVDNTKVGKDMAVAIFRSGALDTLAPTKEAGEADLGNVTVDGTAKSASAGTAYDALLSQLGLSSAGAEYLGAVDDLCLRYTNPDIDGDGTIDALQDDRKFLLDFHVHLDMKLDGHAATIADLAGSFLDESLTSLDYSGTGIYFAYPSAYSASAPDTGSVTFQQDVYYSPYNPPGSTTQGPAGVPLTGGALTINNFGDMKSFGVSASTGHDMPQGEYVFAVGGKTHTFTNVVTRSDSNLTVAENFIMPFIRFNKTNASCTSGCTVSGIDYKWMRRTSTGWVPATLEELSLTVSDSGGYISFRPTTDDNTAQNIGFTVPTSAVEGTLAWDVSSGHVVGVSQSQLQALTIEEVCHLGLSYDDKLGMRLFSGIQNAPGTCN